MSILRRTYSPTEFHHLTAAQAEEMVELQLSRERYDVYRLRTAHGDLCAAMIHGRRAQDFFKSYHPETAAVIGNLLASLGALVPDYIDFDQATRPRRSRA